MWLVFGSASVTSGRTENPEAFETHRAVDVTTTSADCLAFEELHLVYRTSGHSSASLGVLFAQLIRLASSVIRCRGGRRGLLYGSTHTWLP